MVARPSPKSCRAPQIVGWARARYTAYCSLAGPGSGSLATPFGRGLVSVSVDLPASRAPSRGAGVRPIARFGRFALALLGAAGVNAALFWSLGALNAGDSKPVPAERAASRVTFDLVEDTPPVPEPPPEQHPDEAPPLQAAPIALAPAPVPTPTLALPLLSAPPERTRYATQPTPQPKPATTPILDAGQVEVPPRALQMSDPRYPDALKRRRVSGKVTVRVLINRDGRVTRVVLVDVVGHQSFGDAVKRVANAWRFEPARHRGQIVPVWARRTLQFNPSAR